MAKRPVWSQMIGLLALVPLALPLLFLRPALHGITSVSWGDLADCLQPFMRTLTFSIGTTLLVVPFSFLAAAIAWMYGGHRLSWGTVWLIPLLSGGVVWACLWKLVIFRLPWLQIFLASRSPLPFWWFFAMIQMWQFCPAFVFMYWAGLNEIKPDKLHFAEAEGRTFLELLRDTLWPQSRTLTGLLILFYFSQSFQEYVKLQILFKVSEATRTEFITHHLARYLETYMPANAKTAVLDTLCIGVVTGVGGLLFAFLTSFIARRAIDFASNAIVKNKRSRQKWHLPGRPLSPTANCIFLVVGVLVSLPILAVSTVGWNLDAYVLELCLKAIAATLLCGSMTTVAALCSAVGVRLAWPLRFTGDRDDIGFLSAVALCQYFIPALCISLLAFHWLSMLGPVMPGSITTVTVWFCGEFLWAYPLLTIFLVQANTRVSGGEISYLRLFGASSIEIARDSFWKRMRYDYALLFAFGLCLIFTEGTFNSVTSSWSPWTPSIATELLHLAEGRAASFSIMASLCAVALCPLFITVAMLTVGLSNKPHFLGSTRNA